MRQVVPAFLEGAQGGNPGQCPTGASVLGAQKGQVETSIVSDEREARQAGADLGDDLLETGGVGNLVGSDAVNVGSPDGPLRVEPAHPMVHRPPVGVAPNNSQLDDPVTRWRQAGRLDVDHPKRRRWVARLRRERRRRVLLDVHRWRRGAGIPCGASAQAEAFEKSHGSLLLLETSSRIRG